MTTVWDTKPGKRTFWITRKHRDGEIRIPAGVIQGHRPGPVFSLLAGVHGAEYPPIVALQQVFRALNPSQVSGQIRFVFIANLESYKQRIPFVNPIDGKNLNRTFPGSETGSNSESLANLIMVEVVAGSSYLVDLHCGDLVEDLEPFAIVRRSSPDDPVGSVAVQLASNFPLGYLVTTTADSLGWSDLGTSYASAHQMGIPACIAEAGGRGQLDSEAIHILTEGSVNALRWAGVLQGDRIVLREPALLSDFAWVRTPMGGTVLQSARVGERISRGQELAVVHDYFGQRLHSVESPVDGVVLFLTSSPAVADNGVLAGIGVL